MWLYTFKSQFVSVTEKSGHQSVILKGVYCIIHLPVLGWCHSASRVSFFQGLLCGPLLWRSPIPQGLPKGHWGFPSTYSIMQEVSLPQIRFVGAPDVWPTLSCPDYLVNSMVRFVWGPCCMSYVYCFTPAYFSKGKVKNKKSWETKLI
jgi:hypothetical protein